MEITVAFSAQLANARIIYSGAINVHILAHAIYYNCCIGIIYYGILIILCTGTENGLKRSDYFRKQYPISIRVMMPATDGCHIIQISLVPVTAIGACTA